MKHFIFLLLLSLSTPGFSQITTDSITGTWVNTDFYGREMKLVITGDSVTVTIPYRTTPASNEWKNSIYSGSYTIEKGDKLHVIFNEDPREESFYKVVRAEDGSLQIIVEWMKDKKKVDVIYKRQ